MKLIYVTSYAFPSTRAEPYYVRSMAEAFTKALGSDFLLVVRGSVPPEMSNIHTVAVEMSERFRILKYFVWFPFFFWKQKANTPDTVFMSNDPYLVSIFVIWRKILGRMCRYKISSDWHQLFNDWRDTFTTQNSDYLFTTTDKLKKHIVSKCAIDSSKIHVAYGGIDLDFFRRKSGFSRRELREILHLPADAFLVGYVGGFRAVGLEKGLGTMIASLPHLDPQIHMVFVGGSKQHMSEYKEYAKKLCVEERCIFVPKQVFEKVAEYELAMDVLAIPYPDKPHFRDYGFPLKVWEYMAAGRPIVYSNLEIIGEVLNTRGTAFIPDDVVDFARAVNSILRNTEGAETVAYQNTQDILAYTWDERIKGILNSMLDNKVYSKSQ